MPLEHVTAYGRLNEEEQNSTWARMHAWAASRAAYVFRKPSLQRSLTKVASVIQRRRRVFELAVEYICADLDQLREACLYQIKGIESKLEEHSAATAELRRDVNELAANNRADYNDIGHLVRQIAAANARLDKLGKLCEGFMTALATSQRIVETPDGKRYVQVRKPYSTEYELKELPR